MVRIPCVKASLDVRSQAVSYDHGLFFLKIRDPGKAGVKVGGAWFVCAQLFRDKDPLKEGWIPELCSRLFCTEAVPLVTR